MTVVNAAAFGVCLVATDLGQVIDATGASCGSLVCLVFPGLLFDSFHRSTVRDEATRDCQGEVRATPLPTQPLLVCAARALM
jgi:hypothetical protein